MYTVVRFTGERLLLPVIVKLGTALNTIRPGTYSGLRKTGDGFACEICADEQWDRHRDEILRFTSDLRDEITAAIQNGIVVTVDIALEPEDHETQGKILVLRCSNEFLAALTSSGVQFEVSLY